jgi:hypothetical protein
MSSTFDESFQNTLPITMRRGRTFRSGRTRPADGQSNNPETLLRIQSLADYTIDTLESSFQKRQRLPQPQTSLQGQKRAGQPTWRPAASHQDTPPHREQLPSRNPRLWKSPLIASDTPIAYFAAKAARLQRPPVQNLPSSIASARLARTIEYLSRYAACDSKIGGCRF